MSQCQSFSCGDSDLDDFFLNDVENFDIQLLGKSKSKRPHKPDIYAQRSIAILSSQDEGKHVTIW
jgi:hypothetical protein